MVDSAAALGVAAPTSVYDCYECSEYWGRWLDPGTLTVWLPLTMGLWCAGTLLGGLSRVWSSVNSSPARVRQSETL